jgi:hypothetical protein
MRASLCFQFETLTASVSRLLWQAASVSPITRASSDVEGVAETPMNRMTALESGRCIDWRKKQGAPIAPPLLMLALCSALFPNTSHADGWAKLYSGSGYYNGAESAQAGADGSSVITGGELSWVLKLNPSAGIAWQRNLHGASAGTIRNARDGGYVVGYQVGASDGGDARLLKLDVDGNVVWFKTYSGPVANMPGSTYEEQIRAVEPTDDGGYFLVGKRLSPANAAHWEAWIVKVDMRGEVVWQRAFRSTAESSEFGTWSGQQTPDGGYVIAGGIYPDNSDRRVAFLLRLDPSGNLIWQRSYAGPSGTYAQSVRVTLDGGYVIGGAVGSGGWIARLDSAGNIIWQKALGGFGVASIHVTPEMDYVVSGGGDAVLVKLNSSGYLVWQRGYGESGAYVANEVQPTSDGGYLVVGGTKVSGASVASILKVDANGDIPGCTIARTSNVTVTDANVSVGADIALEVSTDAAPIHSAIDLSDLNASLTQQCYYAGPTSAANFQGLWWKSPAGSESGWGINFAHQGDVIFATWYTYDFSGKAWWLSMTANKTAENTYAGTLYQTKGPPFSAQPFDPTRVTRTSVGTGTLTFTSARSGTFAYTVNGISQSKAIVPQEFGSLPTCVWGAQPDLAKATNYQDLWWASPPEIESGWGVNFAHQGDTIFATWYTYDFDGTPLWLSATTPRTSTGNYTGTLYRTTGPPFNADPFNPAAVARTPVGTLTLSFTNGNAAGYAYTVALPGSPTVAQTKPVTRQAFRAPGTACQ